MEGVEELDKSGLSGYREVRQIYGHQPYTPIPMQK